MNVSDSIRLSQTGYPCSFLFSTLTLFLLNLQLAGFKLEVVKTTSAGHAKKLASTVDFSTCPDGISFNALVFLLFSFSCLRPCSSLFFLIFSVLDNVQALYV